MLSVSRSVTGSGPWVAGVGRLEVGRHDAAPGRDSAVGSAASSSSRLIGKRASTSTQNDW